MQTSFVQVWRPVHAWLALNWLYAGLVAAIFLFVLIPLLWGSWSAVLLLIFLQLPIYMLHQVEEHFHDRFRRYVNEDVEGVADALTTNAILVTNIGGVWIVDLIALYLAYFVRPGLGLIATDLAILNAVIHIAMAVAKRSYNPGLISAIFLLLPAGAAGWWLIVKQGGATAVDQAWGIGVAIAIHIALLVYVRLRVARLRSLEPAKTL